MSKLFQIFLFVMGIIVLGLLGLSVFYPQDLSDQAEQSEAAVEEPAETVEVVPQTSPIQNTNPFENTYKNPFE